MTIKRLILNLLTVFCVFFIALSLIGSWTRPQPQSQLNLYQTDLMLHASEWQGFVRNQDPLAPPNNPLREMNPLQDALKNYQKARESAQSALPATQISAPASSDVELDLEMGSPPVLRSPEAARSQLIDELDLRLGILYTQTDQTPKALKIWTDLINAPRAKDHQNQRIETAEILLGLWSQPPRLLPNAEVYLQDHLTGWFRYISLKQLYQLQQRQEDLLQLQDKEQETAESAFLRLAFVSGLPIVGSVIGIIIILTWLVQAGVKRNRLGSGLDGAPPSPPSDQLGADSISSSSSPDQPSESSQKRNLGLSEQPSTATDPLSLTVSNSSSGLTTKRQSELASSVLWPVETIWQVMVVWFTAFFLVSGFLPVMVHLVGLKPETFGPRAQAYFALLNYGLLVIVGLSILYFSLRPFLTKPFRWLRCRWRGNWLGWGVSGYLAALPLVLLTSLINQQLLKEQGGGNPLLEIILQNRDGFTIGLLYILVAVLAPFFEEILFRGFFLTSLTRYFSTWQAIGLSAIVFAIAHLNLSDILPLTVLGCVLGFVYTRSRNLLSSMLLHNLWNAGSFLGLLILGSSGR